VRPWSIDECAKFGFVGWLRPKCPRDMEDEIVADAAKAVDDGQYDKAMERLRGANLTEVQAQTQVLVQLEAVLMKGAVDWAEGTAADAEHSRADLLNLEAVFRRFEEAKLLSFDATKRLTELKAYRRARLALDLVQEGHMREATAALEEASRLDPATYSKPAPGVAHLLAVRGLERAADSAALSAQERTEASAWLDAALQFNDDMPMIHWGMGLLDDTPEVRLARLHLPRAGLLLQSAEPSMNLAVVLGQARQPREAAKWAEQAQIAEPQSDDAWFLLGQAWAAAEEWTKAIRALDRVSPQSEIYADAATSAAALAFERLGQPEEAMRRLGLSLQYKPEDLSLLVSYAETLYANGKTEKSKQIAARALKRPDNGDAMQSKAKTAALFILFATSYAEGRIDDAQLALWQIARRVKNQRQIKLDDDWMFNGVRAAVKKGWDQASANDIAKVLNVLDFVESNGQKGSTDQMASVLQARSAK
jgi:tetratricopeptide (TPR) repeat protein